MVHNFNNNEFHIPLNMGIWDVLERCNISRNTLAPSSQDLSPWGLQMAAHAPRPCPVLERDGGCAHQHGAHAVPLHVWLKMFLCWEVGKLLHILCHGPLTEPHGLHSSEKERWKSGVYGGFYCSFQSVRKRRWLIHSGKSTYVSEGELSKLIGKD